MARIEKVVEKSVSDSFELHTYVEWVQKVSRNLNEHNFLLSIKDQYDRTLIQKNCDLFIEIQNLLKVEKPHLNELTFDQILEYVYLKRVYWDIWYDGVYLMFRTSEHTPSDEDLKKFIRLHFDPAAKKLNGSSMDKVIFWIKEGWSLDSIIDSLKHYFDNKKMYQGSGILIENMDCGDFLELSKEKNFDIFKTSYTLMQRLNEKMRKKIQSDFDLMDSHFSNIVSDYIKYRKNRFNVTLFDRMIAKSKNYNDNVLEFLTMLHNSIRGFNFDLEVKDIRKAANEDKNITIIADKHEYLVYKINTYAALQKYGSPHWCIVTSREYHVKYVGDNDFYIVLQRYPVSKFDFKLGVTIQRENKTYKILHCFNYNDVSNDAEGNKFLKYFDAEKLSLLNKVKRFFTFKKKAVINYDNQVPAEMPVAEMPLADEDVEQEITEAFDDGDYATEED